MKENNKAIEQDLTELSKITVFTFDLNRPGFVEYFQNRTGAMITECDCGWTETVKEINNPSLPHYIIIRQKLQNCWELFTQN